MVVAGLGLPLAARVLAGPSDPAAMAPVEVRRGLELLRVARRAQPVGAASAVVALALDPGTAAGVIAVGWLAVCLVATGAAAVSAWHRRPPPWPAVDELAALVGLAYLSVGGSWLVISRFGWRPLDLSTDIVRLTAVHFHYAGFALPLLGALALRAVAGGRGTARRTLTVGCVAAVVGPPVVALGFTSGSAVAQVGGAVVVTVAAWGVAAGTLWSVRPARGRLAAVLLAVSAASPVVGMVLAVQWAIGQHAAVPALSVDDMAATHGLLNGVGFVMAGLAGWTLLPASASAPASAGLAAPVADGLGPASR